MIKLMQHQKRVLEDTYNENRVAYYLDMGLGKTFVGGEKLNQLHNPINLVICQKSKINDWVEHFEKYYPDYEVFDLTVKNAISQFINAKTNKIGVINYDLCWRRKELLKLNGITLMLDESSLIQNSKAKRTKFILKLKEENVILLSGTPTSGKYENLWTQAKLLGWNISEQLYLQQYVNRDLTDFGMGVYVWVVNKKQPYKNVERLKRKFREYGAVFMKTDEVLDLPAQQDVFIRVKTTPAYKKFVTNSYISIGDTELIGDTTLTKMLYCRKLASEYNENKLKALQDLIDSTNDRLIMFYNFNSEIKLIKELTDKPISIINGAVKDLTAYETEENSITLVQYQAGAMGLNLQKANKIIYFSLPLQSDLFEQSKKRIHRIGQSKPCFYYYLLSEKSVDIAIKNTLDRRQDYTSELFKGGGVNYRRRKDF